MLLLCTYRCAAGKLVTVFSAPDYPQFQVEEENAENGGKRYENLAAVAVLSAPDFTEPNMRTFAAVKPRPKVREARAWMQVGLDMYGMGSSWCDLLVAIRRQ